MQSRSQPVPRLAKALGLLLLGAAACQSPGAQRIVGPDGSQMSHVHCGSDQAECFRIAGELCPTGYELRPVLSANDGNFLVRCRAAAAPQVASCPTPARVVVAARSQATHNQSWPPSSEPWPATSPWPPAETSANVRGAPAPARETDPGLLIPY
jgi:hypothetical protein